MQTKYFKFKLSYWRSKKETLTVWLSGKNTMNEIFDYLSGYLHFNGTNMSGMEENMIRKVKKVVYCNNENKFILHLPNDDGIKAKPGDLVAKKAVRGFRKDGKYKNLRIYSLMGKNILTRSVEVKGVVTTINSITEKVGIKFKRSGNIPLLIIENEKTVKNIRDIVDYVSRQNDLGYLYLEIEGGDGLVKVDEINYDTLTATVNNNLNISTVNNFDFVTTLRSCPPISPYPSYYQVIPTEEYTSFLTGLPIINVNNTITLKFSDTRNFITDIPNVAGLAGIKVIVFYLPKGTKIEDLKYINDTTQDVYCAYYLVSPSGSRLKFYDGNAVGSSREGLLTINVENAGYTGISGNTRLYIFVKLDYRDSKYAFYVN